MDDDMSIQYNSYLRPIMKAVMKVMLIFDYFQKIIKKFSNLQ